MFRACFVALIVAFALAAPPPDAAAQARKAKPAAADTLSPDEAFVQIRQAVMQEQRARFDELAPRASQQPVLGSFVGYWKLRLMLAAPQAPEGDDWSELDRQVQATIARHEETMAADLLRRDWILNLGRRGQWELLEQLYPTWQLRDESPSHCYGLVASIERASPAIQRDSPLAQQARDTLAGTVNIGEPCALLAQTLLNRRLISRGEVFARVIAAADANATGGVRRLGAVLGMDVAALESAMSRPQRASAERDIELVAITRLARLDAREAVQRIEASSLPAADKGLLLVAAGAASMRRLESEALAWVRQGIQIATTPAPGAAPNALPYQMSDDMVGWAIRAALRAQDWALVRTLTARLSVAGQREPTWVYWRARALAALKRDEESQALMRSIAGQFHFYGQLANEALGQLTTVPSPINPALANEEIAEVSRHPGFARALEFYRLGLRMEGNREWNYTLRGMTDRQLLAAAQWACSRQILDRCVNTADRTAQDHDFRLRFIQPFAQELRAAATEQGVDPNWVYGLIRQESRFIMDARSVVGASGLMQLMPATARWVARRAGLDNFRIEQVNDLEINLKLGTTYLRNVLDDLDGSALLASAAYNAGPNRPRSWRATLPGPVEGALFAELIPFTETRDYVKKVLSNATFYAALNTQQPQSLLQRLGRVAPKAATPSTLP
jgi:soluble lytic murein transglycosylase